MLRNDSAKAVTDKMHRPSTADTRRHNDGVSDEVIETVVVHAQRGSRVRLTALAVNHNGPTSLRQQRNKCAEVFFGTGESGNDDHWFTRFGAVSDSPRVVRGEDSRCSRNADDLDPHRYGVATERRDGIELDGC